MEFTKSLIKGKLVKRYKRFFTDIKVNKEIITAHCPNTGSMMGLLDQNNDVWVSKNDDPKRKLKYTLEIIKVKKSTVYHFTKGQKMIGKFLKSYQITRSLFIPQLLTFSLCIHPFIGFSQAPAPAPPEAPAPRRSLFRFSRGSRDAAPRRRSSVLNAVAAALGRRGSVQPAEESDDDDEPVLEAEAPPA